MDISNDFNRSQYTKFAEQYLLLNQDTEIGGWNAEWRAEIVKQFLPKGRLIFEIGAGGGDDAVALRSAWYEVIPTDFVQPFVEELVAKGFPAFVFDAKEDAFPVKKVDAIYANAVFVHFSPKEIHDFLVKAQQYLDNEKLIFISVLLGSWTTRAGRNRGFDRDFQYYYYVTLKNILDDAGYDTIWSKEIDKKWIQIVAKVRE